MSAPTAPPPTAGASEPPSRSTSASSAARRGRRRRIALGALAATAVAAAIVGAVMGAGSSQPNQGERAGAPARAERTVDRLSLKQQVGQTLVLSFRGTEAPDYVLDLLRERRAAGVVLFAENILSPGQLRDLTAELQRAAGGRALIAADQEGGAIRQLPWAAPVEGQALQATEREAAKAARDAAIDLRAAGVNLNLAPIADVGAPQGSAVGGRAFPGDVDQVASLVGASVRSHLDGGVAPAPKHFPGFGAAQANTDDEPVTIDVPREQLIQRDLEPFRAAIEARTPLVMASHALYPAFDRQRIASQSPAILDGLLRRRLGFGGAVITDSIEADAVLSRSSVATAAARSVTAGADLVLMTGPGSYSPVYRQLLTRARRVPSFRRRVEQSAERVIALGDELRRAQRAAR